MSEQDARRVIRMVRWLALAGGAIAILVIPVVVLTYPSGTSGNIPHPLAPPATDSPRATLESFRSAVDEAEKILRAAYEVHINEPGFFRSGETQARVKAAQAYLNRAIRCFDTSEIPPSVRARTALEAALQLQEVLERVKLPETDAIPDRTMMKAAIDRGERAQWTIPNSEIRIARIDSGPRAGEYLFTAETVGRSHEFYRLVHGLPGVDRFDFYEYYALSPGDLMPPKWYAFIRRLPDWFLQAQNEHARWQWIGVVFVIAVAVLACLGVYHWTWHRRDTHWLPPLWQSVLLPLTICLAAWLGELCVEELNITGPARRNLSVGFEVVSYIALAWLVVAFFNRISVWAAASWGAHAHGFDTGIIRVAVSVIGIGLATGVLVYGANDVGIPLVGIIAGLGVGGLAVALAAQPTLENLIGGVMIYADRPVRVGDHCKFGDMTGVVEEIGIRSTRLRAPDRSLISIPNADFARLRLVNYSRRDRQQFSARIGLEYGTSQEQLRALMAELRQALRDRPDINPESVQVRLASFGAKSIEFDLAAEVDNVGPDDAGQTNEELLMQLLKIVEKSGASLTVHG